MVCTLVSETSSTPIAVRRRARSEKVDSGRGRGKLKIVLRQGYISAAHTTWSKSEYRTKRLTFDPIVDAPAKDLHLWFYQYY